MTLFKFLDRGAVGPFSGRAWPVPDGAGRPGEWMAAARLEPCRTGLHLCRPEDLPFWVCAELYTVEVEGEVVAHGSFVLAHRARLLARVDAWLRETATAFCDDCALRVRDLAVAGLEAAGRPVEAGGLSRCATTDDLVAVAGRIAEDPDLTDPLVGYAYDAARFAALTRIQEQWPAGTATTAFVAARAAGAAAASPPASSARVGPPAVPEPAMSAAVAAERRRQAAWLAAHMLVAP